MAFEEMREGIGSLNAGAPDITYEGNEGQQAPMKMASDPDPMDERNMVMESIAIKEFGRP